MESTPCQTLINDQDSGGAFRVPLEPIKPLYLGRISTSSIPIAPNRGDCKFYVCPVLDCKSHLPFEDRQTWEDHLQTHPQSPTWACTAISYGIDLPEFRSISDFQDHMSAAYSRSFDESDLPELADACNKPHRCNLCSTCILDEPSKEERSKSILDHRYEHFVELEICL